MIQDLEGIVACRHAAKTYSVESLGQGKPEAGGAKARKHRFELLDRVAGTRAGLSPGQKNDWQWFKEEWDKNMASEHGDNWGGVFARWMKNVLDDESSNAFSAFVYRETCRVLHAAAVLQVPGE